MKITEISIRRPILVIVGFTVLSLLGLLSYFSLNYELLPKFAQNVVSVSTVYPGASPSEVENTVTKAIEDAISSMENVKKIESTSYESLSIVTIALNNGADADLALNDAQRKVNAILGTLPKDIKSPALNKFSLEDLPVMTMSASADMEDAEFFDLIDKRIANHLARVPGVAQVNLIGGEEREIQVSVNESRLEGYQLSLLQVQQKIAGSNLDFPTGNVKSDGQDILIRLAGKYQTVEELRNLIIKVLPGGGQIRLRDVAEIRDGQKETEKIARVNGKNAIALQIVKQSDANAVEVSEGIQKLIGQLQAEYSHVGLQINIANDSSVFTLQSADAVIHDLMLAIILVAFVMLFFLHSLRNALIVMVSIPASLVATFIGMQLLDYSLNLMSLLGLSLVIGILVDDAIVVLENIYRHMEMGKNRARAAVDATKEIGFTVTSITLVIVVVFFPIALSTGFVSDILREFCVVVIISTLLSLLTSFTIIPLLSSRFGKLEHLSGSSFYGRIILAFENQLNRFNHWMTGLLDWALAHKRLTLGLVLMLLFASFSLVGLGFIGNEFFAKTDRGEFLVQLELPKEAPIEQTNEVARQAEAMLAPKKEITSLITTVGQSSDGMGASKATAYKAEINVKLVPVDQRDDDATVYAAKISRELAKKLVGVKVKTVPINILGTAEKAPIDLAIVGSDLDSVLQFAEAAKNELTSIPGATEVKLSVEKGNPEIRVNVDRDKMAALGLDLQAVGATMQTAFSGNTDSKFRSGEYEYDINIRYDGFNRQSIEDVRNLLFINDTGDQIRLSQFADVIESSGPSLLQRRDRSTSVSVQAQSIGRPSGTIADEWEAKLIKMKKPAGISYVWGGEKENQTDGFGTLGIALLASIILVYLIMVALYNSFLYPLVVMFSIPLAIIGALLALALTNDSLNIFTILGLIMLIGLVAKNAIIIVDFTNQMKQEGKSTRDALILANQARLRPILMTTLAMIIGMLPIAVASGAGAEWKNGLAWVIIGGLISSLFLTLVIVPVIYLIFDILIGKFKKKENGSSIDQLLGEAFHAAPAARVTEEADFI